MLADGNLLALVAAVAIGAISSYMAFRAKVGENDSALQRAYLEQIVAESADLRRALAEKDRQVLELQSHVHELELRLVRMQSELDRIQDTSRQCQDCGSFVAFYEQGKRKGREENGG